MHPQTAKWLTAAGLPGTLPPAGPTVSDPHVAAMHRAEPISGSEIARRLGISTTQALAALHREGADIDPARQAAAARAASARGRGTVPSLPADQAEQADKPCADPPEYPVTSPQRSMKTD